MAINVLVTTDDASKEWAEKSNLKVSQVAPQSFRFDDSHLSHISVYQAYVDISCFDDKSDEIEKEMKSVKLLKDVLKPQKILVEDLPVLPFSPNEKIKKLQKKMQEILLSCRAEKFDGKSFIGPLPKDDFIQTYVQQYSLDNYRPFMSLGIGLKEDLNKLTIENPPTHFTVKRIGIFRSGAWGTARERLLSVD